MDNKNTVVVDSYARGLYTESNSTYPYGDDDQIEDLREKFHNTVREKIVSFFYLIDPCLYFTGTFSTIMRPILIFCLPFFLDLPNIFPRTHCRELEHFGCISKEER